MNAVSLPKRYSPIGSHVSTGGVINAADRDADRTDAELIMSSLKIIIVPRAKAGCRLRETAGNCLVKCLS